MVKIETEVLIDRPVKEVFAFMANVENDSQWSSGTESRFISKGPIGKGSTFKEVAKFLGKKIETTGKYVEFIPNEKIVCKIISGPIPGEGIFNFESDNSGTKITIKMEVEIGGFFKFTEPLVVRMFKRQMEAEHANLKDLLESQI